MTALQPLFLNISVIFIPIFLTQFFIQDIRSPRKRKSFIFLFQGLSIVLCMSFPFWLVSDYRFDLRFTPLVLGALYGGPWVGFALTVVTVLYRLFFITTQGIASSLLFYILLFLMNMYMYHRIWPGAGKSRRIGTAVCNCAIGLVLLIALTALRGTEFKAGLLEAIAVYFVVQLLAISAVVYFIETLHETMSLKGELLKLEKQNVVGQMAASIAHEVRNPLTVVRGFLQLFKQADMEPDKREQFLTLAIEELDRAQEILSDFLSIAKPESDTQETLDVSKKLQQVIDLIGSYGMMANVDIRTDFEPEILIKGNRQGLIQCLVNLIKNAIESMPNGGTVTVRLFRMNQRAVIQITDTGVGMTPEQLDRLGTLYYSTKQEGTGLGLMLSYRVIHALKGTIKVTSDPGKGTTFTLTIPCL